MKCDVPDLSGDNYKLWKERILLQLGCMDIDFAIRKDEPHSVTSTSTQAEIAAYERWERSNRLSMMFIRTKISASIRGSIPECKNVKELLKAIDAQFESSDKALASTLMTKLSSMKLTTVGGVREHIMKMRDIAAQLKSLEVEMSESFLVHFILSSLPQQYSPFKISYNTHKDKWSINELLTMCVQEEGRLILEMGESAHLVTQRKTKAPKAKRKGKGKVSIHTEDKKESKCFFCKKKGHIKKDCLKFKAWLDKKGTLTSFVCHESNLVICHNTWWIDSGSTIHVSNTLQGFLNQRKPLGSEQSIYSGNKMGSHVEAIGTCRLILHSGFVLDLEKTFYIPSFSRNLISVSRLVPAGYSFNFNKSSVDLFYKSKLIGNGTLSDNLFQINLKNNTTYNVMHAQTGMKRCVMNENSSILWHRRLGHISIERIKRLVKDGVLDTLDFADFGTCVDCIKGKQTNKSKKDAKRSSEILEIIHTDICSPDMDSYGQRYFISFIDDYS